MQLDHQHLLFSHFEDPKSVDIVLLEMVNYSVIMFLIASFICSHVALGEQYVLTGNVTNVAYLLSKTWPCYIAVNDNSSSSNNHFHAARSESICSFAERAMIWGKMVKMYNIVDDGNNIAYGIQFNDTGVWKRAPYAPSLQNLMADNF